MKKITFLLIIDLVLNSMIINGQIIETLVDNGGYKLHFSILPEKECRSYLKQVTWIIRRYGTALFNPLPT